MIPKKYIATNINEYLNSQSENEYSDIVLYHGTANDFDEFDIEKSGMIQYSDQGKGIYFTRSKSQANSYRIDAVKKSNKEYNDSYEEYERCEKELNKTKKGTPEYEELNNLSQTKLKKFQNIGRELYNTKDGRLIVAKIKPDAKIYKYESGQGMTDPNLSNKMKLKGYDIILIDENKYTEEFVVINPKSIIITGEIKEH